MSMRYAFTLLATLSAVPGVTAWAQSQEPDASENSFKVWDTWLIEPEEGTFYEAGAGSPSVVWDPRLEAYVMFFETRFAPIPDRDPQVLLQRAFGDDAPPVDRCIKGEEQLSGPGYWGIGRAFSRDGVTWLVDPDPVLVPETDSYYDCVVAHPTVVLEDGTYHMWFKGQQRPGACPDGDDAPDAPPWGCKEYTGIGYASSSNGSDWEVTERPVINLSVSTFGFPSVVKLDDTWWMTLHFRDAGRGLYDIYQTSAPNPRDWGELSVVIRRNVADWARDEMFNPSMNCRDATSSQDLGVVTLSGGRARDFSQCTERECLVVDAGVGQLFGATPEVMVFNRANTPAFRWERENPGDDMPGQADWRHWDLLLLDRHSVTYFSQKGSDGRNRIGMATSLPLSQIPYVADEISDKVCRSWEGRVRPDTSDTGFAPPLPTDSGFVEPECGKEGPDCDGCASAGPASGLPFLTALPLWLLFRRRREDA